MSVPRACTPAPLSSAVVIITADPAHQMWLGRCLSYVLNGSTRPDQVLVVADGDRRYGARLRRQILDDRVRVIDNNGRGWAAAANTGIQSVETDLIALLPDDASVDEKWLDRIAEAFVDDRVVALTGKVEPLYGRGARPLPEQLLGLIGAGCPMADGVGEPRRTTILRREAVLAVGGFHEGFRDVDRTGLSLGRLLLDRYGPAAIMEIADATIHQFVPAGQTSWGSVARAAWREGRELERHPWPGLFKSAVRCALGGQPGTGFLLAVAATSMLAGGSLGRLTRSSASTAPR